VATTGLGVVSADFNGDQQPDIFVANDGAPNLLWINQGNGVFRDDATQLGTAYNMNGQEEAGMGVVVEDLDADGDPDLFLTHLRLETNTFYRNLGPEIGFVDATGTAGLASTSMSLTGFGAAALDLDLDGDLDLAVANGGVNLGQREPDGESDSRWSRLAERNLIYLNIGKGHFEASSMLGQAFTEPVEVSRALVAADLDRDGDEDLLVTNIEGKTRIYRNDAPRAGGWLTVRAIDPRLRRDAIGARVTVVTGPLRSSRLVTSAGSYLSSRPSTVHFGLGPATRIDWVEVAWPDGLVEQFCTVTLGTMIELRRGEGGPCG
jgi:hypothetical protein